jgi:C-terminal processing protease CtpA/Prc
MVAAFAVENQLARIVGTATPGRLVGSKPFKLRYGYFLILPVGAYVTWQGKRLEGEGVRPQVEVPLSYDAVATGRDNQLDAAIEIVKDM